LSAEKKFSFNGWLGCSRPFGLIEVHLVDECYDCTCELLRNQRHKKLEDERVVWIDIWREM